MRMIFKGGLATLALGVGIGVSGSALAESYDSRGFAFGSHEAYLIQHCTYNPCNIDYSTMPNWPSNPYYRHPRVRVYEYPGYSNDQYPPPPPPTQQYPDSER